ncbi:phosphotransferase enzyme family protein [Metarhizium rileyi]|uniref:Phosphotransferase enzyme family protein n=1 Tax=Metarhizium rileyi (strain RCEF 4871) TaxID=1649241 RepID=A0A167F4K1_METRR|nr:phosphotransferase enzyme family protein [Metarhizium rileyi RCEF 4871]
MSPENITSETETGNQGFPLLTEDQFYQAKRSFIASLNSDAVCALASRYNHGHTSSVLKKDSGSFNVCFFVGFDHDGSHSGMQMYLITVFIPGESLDKRLLVEAGEESRQIFYSQLIDILAELRKLEFALIGSLMPNPDVADHTVEDIRAEVFALDGMKRMFDQLIDTDLNAGPFVLSHLDLRSRNIIVDENLRIRGTIDWEFASAVPLQVFTPPSWIAGHNSVSTNK